MKTYLGLQVDQLADRIELHLDNYVQEILEDYKNWSKKKVGLRRIPMQPGINLSMEEVPDTPTVDQSVFRSFVMRLNFAAQYVRFDMAFPVSQLARFTTNAGPQHWAALHYLMEYLNFTPSLKITYRRGDPGQDALSGCVDADWGNDNSRRSQTGYFVFYNKAPIAWKSKLQPSVALSTGEAEYMAASDISKEIIYLRRLVGNLGFEQRAPTPVGEDNTACIEWGNHVIGGRERAKHIDIRKHFARQAIKEGHLILIKVPTRDQMADIMTKALPYARWEHCMSMALQSELRHRP
jgi:hypothetical protein